MILKYCQCGQLIEVDAAYNGLAYYTVFRDPETGNEIDHCPGCGESVTTWLEMGTTRCLMTPEEFEEGVA